MKNINWWYNLQEIKYKYISIKNINFDYFNVVANLWIIFYNLCNRESKYPVPDGLWHDTLLQQKGYEAWLERFRALSLLDQYGLPQDCVDITYNKLTTEFEEMVNIKWSDFRKNAEKIVRETYLKKQSVFYQEKSGRPTNYLIDVTLIGLDKAFPDVDERGEIKAKNKNILECMNVFSHIPMSEGYDKLIPATESAVRNRIGRIKYAGGEIKRKDKINNTLENLLKNYQKRKLELTLLVKKGIKNKKSKKGSLISLINKSITK